MSLRILDQDCALPPKIKFYCGGIDIQYAPLATELISSCFQLLGTAVAFIQQKLMDVESLLTASNRTDNQ